MRGSSVGNSPLMPRWALGLLAVVSLLAVSVLLLAIVLGVRAGQQQIEIQRKQQIGLALQKAIDYQAVGNFGAALDEYKRVLSLDPNNIAANEGVKTILQPGIAPVAVSPSSASPKVDTNLATSATLTITQASMLSTNQTAPSPSLSASDLAALWNEAQEAAKAGRSQQAIEKLLRVRQADASYQTLAVNDALFNAYIQSAEQQDSEDNLEGARNAYAQALALRPTATAIGEEISRIDQYLDMLSYYDVNWPKAIELLDDLARQDPTYRGVNNKLLDARITYGDQLVTKGTPCAAIDQFDAAIRLVGTTPTLSTKRSNAQVVCTTFQTAVALSGTLTTTVDGTVDGTAVAQSTSTTPSPDGTPGTTTAVTTQPAESSPLGVAGRILYGTRDLNDGRVRIYAQPAAGGSPTPLLEDATQPALRNDGQRMAYHNLRSDLAGISAYDPATGAQIRFSSYAEDSFPSWNAAGNRIAFASTRESDRNWRVYLMWAQENAEVTEIGPGESPDWHPSIDLFVYRGCDATGNGCGLWVMDSNGGNRRQLTNVPADTRPKWSATGAYVAFMSDGRDGNPELYRVDASNGQVLRLTNSPYTDAIPAVSPDGQSVAFVSNRDGAWKLWVISIHGGEPRLLAPLRGDFGDWSGQKIQWVN